MPRHFRGQVEHCADLRTFYSVLKSVITGMDSKACSEMDIIWAGHKTFLQWLWIPYGALIVNPSPIKLLRVQFITLDVLLHIKDLSWVKLPNYRKDVCSGERRRLSPSSKSSQPIMVYFLNLLLRGYRNDLLSLRCGIERKKLVLKQVFLFWTG